MRTSVYGPGIEQGKKRYGSERWLALVWLFVGLCPAWAELVPSARTANTVLAISITRPLTLCQGSVTQIQAAVPADFKQNWYWTKDGQRFSRDRETSVTLNQSGTYTLGGEWEGDPSVTVNGTFVLTMIDKPLTTVTASSLTVCAGTSFTLAGEPSSANNLYEWVDSQHRFVLAGSVLVTNSPDAYSLVVVSPSACTYVATAPLVTAYASQSITLQPDGPTTFCEGYSVRLTQAGGELVNPVWLRNNQPLTGPYSATLTVTEGGAYAVRGEGGGCIQFPPSLSVTVGTRPSVQLVTSQAVVCRGEAYELAVQPADPTYQYAWTDPSGKSVNASGSRFSTTEERPFNVRVTTPLGCSLVITSEGIVQFRPLTLLTIGPTGGVRFCEGSAATLTATVGTLQDYHWTRNGLLLPTTENRPQVTVTTSGTYAVAGAFPTCTRLQNPLPVQVDPLPTLQIVPSSLTLCEGQTALVTAETELANALHWRRDGAEAGTARSLKAVAGNVFSLTTTSPGGCQQTATYAFTPQVVAAPVFALDPVDPIWPNTLIQPGGVPQQPGYGYQWTPAAGASDPASAQPQLNPSVATSYTLTITDARGCTYSDVLTLTFVTKLLAPTAFTPNGDGQNDTWFPPNLDRFPNAEIRIYDRWGTAVYTGRAGDAPFDGTLQGQALPGGVYAYRIRLNIQQAEVRGTVVLIR